MSKVWPKPNRAALIAGAAVSIFSYTAAFVDGIWSFVASFAAATAGYVVGIEYGRHYMEANYGEKEVHEDG